MPTGNTTGIHAHTTRKGQPLSIAASYALAKQVPDLETRGCIISTSYGDIAIAPGRLADRLAKLLTVEISKGGLQ